MSTIPFALSIASLVVFILSFVSAIGLFMALIFKRRAKKSLSLFPLNSSQQLDNEEARRFSYIKYDANLNAIVLKQKDSFKKCVITLISRGSKGVKMERYKCVFKENGAAAIQLNEQISEYLVVVESVDGRLVKHNSIDNHLVMNIVYGAIVTILHVTGIVLYVILCSYYLRDYWAGYAVYYAFAVGSLSFAVIVILGYLLIETLSRKGVL